MGNLLNKDKLVLLHRSTGLGYVLIIRCKVCFGDIYIGASISVNGICLTVTAYDEAKETVEFGIAPETIRCTNILDLKKDSLVNLERAAKSGGRNSGHYVQGHVDCTGEIVSKKQDEDSLFITVKVQRNTKSNETFEGVTKNIVKKGFVAIDGTSLTVTDAKHLSEDEFVFSFMLVQFTQNHVRIPKLNIGEFVNIEVDAMGKYMSSHLNEMKAQMEQYCVLSNKVASLERTVEVLQARISELEKNQK